MRCSKLLFHRESCRRRICCSSGLILLGFLCTKSQELLRSSSVCRSLHSLKQKHWEWPARKRRCEVVLWALSREVQDLMFLPGRLQCEECWVCPSRSGQKVFSGLIHLEATLFPKGKIQGYVSDREEPSDCGLRILSESYSILRLTSEKSNPLKGSFIASFISLHDSCILMQKRIYPENVCLDLTFMNAALSI